MNLVFYILVAITFLIFGGFALFSYREKEARAFRLSAIIAFGGGIVFALMTLFSSEVKIFLLIILGVSLLVLLILSLLPIGKIELCIDLPGKHFDESVNICQYLIIDTNIQHLSREERPGPNICILLHPHPPFYHNHLLFTR